MRPVVAEGTLFMVGLVHAATAAAFATVGHRLRRRRVGQGERLANSAAVVWWWGMGLYMAIQAALTVPAAFGSLSASMAQATRIVAGPVIATAAWGISFHILYLFLGRRWLVWPLAAYYAVAGLLYSGAAVTHPTVAVMPTPWEVSQTLDPAWVGPGRTLVLAMVGLPLVLSSIAYLSLAFRVETRAQRYRVLLVGSGILLWVVAGFAGQVAGGPLARFATIVVLGLLVSMLVSAAYFPPPRLRQWLERPRRA